MRKDVVLVRWTSVVNHRHGTKYCLLCVLLTRIITFCVSTKMCSFVMSACLAANRQCEMRKMANINSPLLRRTLQWLKWRSSNRARNRRATDKIFILNHLDVTFIRYPFFVFSKRHLIKLLIWFSIFLPFFNFFNAFVSFYLLLFQALFSPLFHKFSSRLFFLQIISRNFLHFMIVSNCLSLFLSTFSFALIS